MTSPKPLMTVSGVRGIVDESLTEYLCFKLAFIQTVVTGSKLVVVGRDTRPSGPRIARAIFRGITAAGAQPVDLGVCPTPTTCLAARHFNAGTGVIITASHNPSPYNGYKMVHATGRLFNDAECRSVYSRLDDNAVPPENRWLSYSADAKSADAVTPHIDAICRTVDVAAIRTAGVSVAIDATNGAAGVIFPTLLEKLGVDWQGVYTDLSGEFLRNPEPRPEHLTELADMLKKNEKYWGGFAFDPDADRLAPMGEHGEPLTEELTLALALECVLSATPGRVATNLSTSMLVDDVATACKSTVIRSKIGEANVVETMLKNGCVMGGEGNGGVIYPPISTARDGLAALSLIIERMAKTGKKMTGLASRWPTYTIVKEKIPLPGSGASMILKNLAVTYASERIDVQDGLKITRTNGWVHIRPSNTEPIVRIIAESRTENEARQMIQEIRKNIG